MNLDYSSLLILALAFNIYLGLSCFKVRYNVFIFSREYFNFDRIYRVIQPPHEAFVCRRIIKYLPNFEHQFGTSSNKRPNPWPSTYEATALPRSNISKWTLCRPLFKKCWKTFISESEIPDVNKPCRPLETSLTATGRHLLCRVL